MKGLITIIVAVVLTGLSLPSNSVIYTRDFSKEFNDVMGDIACLKYFQNENKSSLALKAALNTQDALAENLRNLKSYPDIAEAIAISTLERRTKKGKSTGVPFTCWHHIPQDHGLTPEELEAFLDTGEIPQ